ncbi:MAG: helix-turn-helix domain-containing protein [Spirochaetia bacterium]
MRIVTDTEFDLQNAVRYASAFTDATGIGCTILDRQGWIRHPALEDYPCRLCRAVTGTEIDIRTSSQDHWRRVEQAARYGGRHIFLCENSFTHWTSPIVTEGRVTGALVAGPVLTIDDEGFFENELLPDDVGDEQRERLRKLFRKVPQLPPARITALSQLLYSLARTISDATGRALDEAESELERQSRMSEYVHDLKRQRRVNGLDPEFATYPLDKERALLDQIRVGNISRAQETLNELLGHVFFASGSEIDSIRHRARELLVLLSRAVLTEGADPEEVFGLNYRFVDALDQQQDINGIAYWMARIARRFADLILYMPNVAHGTVMRKAVRHIKSHLSESIRIRDVAEQVGLSPTYFSRLFAREMGKPFVTYVTHTRMERARELLRTTNGTITSIASDVGIQDHSYFTKLFRRETGVTPSTYRASGA